MNPLQNRRILLIDDMPSIYEDFRKILIPMHRSTPAEPAISSPTPPSSRTEKGNQAMKAIRFIFIAMFAFAAYAAKGHAEPVTLIFVHGAAPTHPTHLAAMQFAKRVEQRTDGQIKFDIFPAGQLGGENEALQKIRLGAIAMGTTAPSNLIKYEKAFAVVIMPYLFDSYEHAHRVLDGPAMSWLAPLAEKQGFVILSNWEWGFRHVTNNQRPINQPEDMRGLKIRVPPVVQLEDTMKALDAQISKIAFKELYMALSQGVVDGQENPLHVIYYNKLYEVQKHLALTQHVYHNQLHLISVKSWAMLTPEQQKIVREESKAAGDGMSKGMIAEEDELIAKMVNAGVKVTRPDLKAFRAKVEPAVKEITAYAGEANVQKFLKMVEDGRKK
ncbi:TRAP transporter substrate-binding protein [Rhodoferax ferrireducens]|uniref:TRAP transporter substrate-binding protein n=1 Tax=Rhodoferax ferrireducens TaxID=192843 RepID=UPI001E3EE5B6|nr:TRAP transporter substrate-binding protein [Rhodoferax ferrireducens]